MQAIKVTDQEFSEYDNFVESHTSGSFLQSREWGNFQKTTGAKVFQYIFKDNEQTVGSAQVFLKNIAGLNKQYLYCPYGPLTLPGIVDVNFFIEQLKRDFPEIICIRVEPKDIFNLQGSKTIRIQPKETVINDLSTSLDEQLAKMHPKTRYNIKIAGKHGVVVKVIDESEAVHLQLLEETSQRQQFKNFPISYFQQLIQELGKTNGMIKVYQASYKDQTLVTAIMIDFSKTRTYLYGGSSNQNRNVMAPYLLHWQAMQDAKNNGLQFYDWWGLRTSEGKISGFTEFKLKFGGQEVTYPEAVDIVTKPSWYTVYTVLRKLNRFALHLPFLRSK